MSNKEDTIKKWASILGNTGLTGSNLDNLSKLAENQSNHIMNETISEDFPSILLPIAMKIAAQTIGQDLVNVQPTKKVDGMSEDELDRIKSEVKSKNRDSKIKSLIEGEEYKEQKIEDHPDYKSGPVGNLFFMDFKYDIGKEGGVE